eukprot:scaffold336060_cov35-Attheya_sp.AAC.1
MRITCIDSPVRAFFIFLALLINAHCSRQCSAAEIDKYTKAATNAINMQEQHRELIEWIRSHPDGFVSDKLEIRVADPNNPALGSGMFVNGPITEGELLYSIPWDLLIKADDAPADGYLGKEMSCGLVRSLLRELRLGDESTFGPYLKYFHSFDVSGLVDHWSEDGQYLLWEISGPEWAPDWSSPDWSPSSLDDPVYWVWKHACD